MKKPLFEILFLLIIMLFSCRHNHNIKQSDRVLDNPVQNDTLTNSIIEIKNTKVFLKVNLFGGSYFDFHFIDLPVNVFNFYSKEESGEPPHMGHFLCFDRWGRPTDAEKANGFKHHGEAHSIDWKLLAEPQTRDGLITCSMMCSLPMGRLQLTRKIELSEGESIFFVTEEIKNLNKYGRMYNIVQHVSLAPPFLDKYTLFDNNTEKGFEDKENGSLNQEEPVLKWPEAIHNGEKVSLRQFQNQWPRVSSFVYPQNDRYGWATASNPGKNLMLGYIWKTEDYPWINYWRSMENDAPAAFGMEFGTTGLHEPYPLLARKGKIFDRNIFAFIDADEIISKSYTVFLARIPEDYKGVEKIEIRDSLIIIKEKAGVSRDIIYHQHK